MENRISEHIYQIQISVERVCRGKHNLRGNYPPENSFDQNTSEFVGVFRNPPVTLGALGCRVSIIHMTTFLDSLLQAQGC